MAYNTNIHPTTGFTPFYLMFGRQAKLPVELMYGIPESESQSSTEYATQLESALTDAYEKVRVNTTRQLDHQAELYNEKVHMKWAAMYGFYFHRCPEINRRNCTAHGQALLLSLNASPM